MRTEDQEFEELEKKIGAKTTDIRDKKDDVCTYPECKCPFDMDADNKCLLGKKQRYATREQRAWFFNEHGWYAPDADVMEAWYKRIENDK